ncbi:potassium-transporting ATPase subunit KdpB [Salinisphaera sp. USBA-960]|nr:potassium-transporting ATPase subunit KdpB [Salifodinibacter halophilus]NNC27023.1 potassium-transporting ATPase subunit KdpB [Salifodinibacter halophilus]
MSQKSSSVFGAMQPHELMLQALARLSPRNLAHNPVMFVVGGGTVISLIYTALAMGQGDPFGVNLAVTLILLATVLFANGAEALAEARGRAHASSLRTQRDQLQAERLRTGGDSETVPASELRRGDHVRVTANSLIPCDGEIVEGAATINESAVTGESAPVLREAGTDHSGVSAGTSVLSDGIVIKVTVDPGNSLLDRMIALVESAKRQKTPNEIALTVLLAAMTLIFLLVVANLVPLADFLGVTVPVPVLVAVLVCLIPTTIGGLLPAIGIAGMDRAMRANLVAKSGMAVEVAGNIDTLLLDKTGTITLGDRQATEFHTVGATARQHLLDAAYLASLADPTPEGQSTVKLAADQGAEATNGDHDAFIEFSAETRLSGVDRTDGTRIRKGATDAIQHFVEEGEATYDAEADQIVDRVARSGATPLVVADTTGVLGVIALSDVIKPGIDERLRSLSEVGVRTVMITGDNPLTAAAIAAEAGVDDYRAEVAPEDKLNLIREEQTNGRLVAMMGDGTNDAPALAQADLGLAMNAGTQAAREAGNMVDLDSDPGKLIEVVEIGKQLLITRGALTTFSLANDVAKYFVILPAIFAASIPALGALNILGMATPTSAVLAAVIFNALLIPALVPFALRGVRFKPQSSAGLLRRNMLLYGLGGLVLPFIAMKAIDLVLGLAV